MCYYLNMEKTMAIEKNILIKFESTSGEVLKALSAQKCELFEGLRVFVCFPFVKMMRVS